MNQVADEFKLQTGKLLDQSTTKILHCLLQLSESEIWWRPDPRLNSIGNLILHICGNLRQWSTTAFSTAVDQRDRKAEFSDSVRKPKQELIDLMSDAVRLSKQAIHDVAPNQLIEVIQIQGFQVSAMEALMHTTSHFQGHTHQIILLTRIIKKDAYQFHWSPEMGRDTLPM